MPVLPLEPYVYPVNLLAGPSESVPADPVRWSVLHTRPRAEKAIARVLVSRRIPFFLPLSRRRRVSRGRIVESHGPLFPSYVFLHGDERQRVQVLETNMVVATLAVRDQVRMHDDLCRIFRLIACGAPLTREDRLEPGTWVEVAAGPLAGLRGCILRRANQSRFVVEVDFLQRGASVEIDETFLTRVATEPPRSSAA